MPGSLVLTVLLGLLVGAIVASLDTDDLHAALTRPTMTVAVVDGKVTPLGCDCVRTLRPDEVPETMTDALIATEDRRFRGHFGVDVQGLARAIVRSSEYLVTGRGQLEGGSTITQQLAKQAIVGTEGGVVRKLVEAATAIRIEMHYDKEDILRLYLSRVDFGWIRGAPVYGLREAARVYYGKAPERLTRAEAAVLVAMLKGTYVYNPLRNPKLADRRARDVIALMRAQGMLDGVPRIDIAAAIPKSARARPARRRYLEDHLTAAFLASAPESGWSDGVYRIVSTIDPIAQWRAEQFLADEVRKARGGRIARGAMIAIDPAGRILAMVGDLDYRKSTYNIAMQGERQAASTAKIATYLAALEGGWTADRTVWDLRSRIRGFAPRNDDNTYRGRIPLRECLRQSRNVCTVWLAEQIGFRKVADMAERIGLTLRAEEGRDIVLGATETTPARLGAAFAVLTNGGKRVTPNATAVILAPLGWASHPTPVTPVETGLSQAAIDAMRGLLAGVVNGGTGHAAGFRDGRAFGKTGTSEDNRDAWFAGFTDSGITTVVWVGPEERGQMVNVYGGSVPARVFSRFNASLAERFKAYAAGGQLPR